MKPLILLPSVRHQMQPDVVNSLPNQLSMPGSFIWPPKRKKPPEIASLIVLNADEHFAPALTVLIR
jgi:hypothetical protein